MCTVAMKFSALASRASDLKLHESWAIGCPKRQDGMKIGGPLFRVFSAPTFAPFEPLESHLELQKRVGP